VSCGRPLRGRETERSTTLSRLRGELSLAEVLRTLFSEGEGVYNGGENQSCEGKGHLPGVRANHVRGRGLFINTWVVWNGSDYECMLLSVCIVYL
jgi:hypothetical protein